MYFTRTKPNTLIYKYLQVDSGGIYVFTYVDWVHTFMVYGFASAWQSRAMFVRGGLYLFHKNRNKLAREN